MGGFIDENPSFDYWKTKLTKENSSDKQFGDDQDDRVPSSKDILSLSLSAVGASPGLPGRGRSKPA